MSDRLEAIAAGDDAMSEAVRSHLHGCARCRTALAMAERIERTLRAVPSVAAPAGFPERVTIRIRDERWHAEERFDRAFNLTLAAAIALMAVGGVALLNLSGLGALMVDAARMATGGIGLPAPGANRLAVTSAVLLATGLSGWWWATRRPGY